MLWHVTILFLSKWSILWWVQITAEHALWSTVECSLCHTTCNSLGKCFSVMGRYGSYMTVYMNSSEVLALLKLRIIQFCKTGHCLDWSKNLLHFCISSNVLCSSLSSWRNAMFCIFGKIHFPAYIISFPEDCFVRKVSILRWIIKICHAGETR